MGDQEYYHPYLPSDSELSDSDEEYDFSRASTPRPENANQDFIDPRTAAPDFAELAKGLAVPLEPTAGPTFATVAQEQAYASQRLDPRVTYSSYSSNTDPKADQTAAEASGAPKYGKVTSAAKDIQTVIMLQSRDRDKTVYPQPTNCQLFLPRIYRNVYSFAIAQINLTSAFFYFRKDKQNVNLLVYEKDTVLYSPDLTPTILTDASGNPLPLRLTRTLRDGSYSASQLMTEIQIQLNQTPIFYDFLNGFSDFLPLFQVNGDYSINFNYPGDYYYDAVRKIYIPNPTRAQIVGFYFQSQFANQFTYTIQQVRVAYYYPVLKEAILDPTTNVNSYNFSGTGLSVEDTIQYLLYSFSGISDPIAATVITNNISLLDTYRLYHTFRYYLINKYVATVDPANNRVTIASPSLNTSLVNLLNTQYNTYLAQQLSKYGLTAAQYNALAENNTKILSVLQSMYDYIQVALARYFAINYGTFSRAYFANMSNTVLIRNGLDASGIAIRYDNKVAPTPRDNDLMEDFRKNPPYYWNRMSNLGGTEGAQRNMGSTYQTYPTSSNFPYNLAASNIDLTRSFIDPQWNIYTDFRRNAGDILVNVDNSKYTIFKFRSKYRQTLQVETLPRQTPFRYPLYNQTNTVAYPLSNLYDVSYCYVAPTPSTFSKITYDVSYNSLNGWSNLSNTNTNFGNTYADSEALWGSSNETINISSSNGRYYTFQTPLPVPLGDKGSNVYTYQFNVTFTCTNGGGGQAFPSDFYAFFYHDIAAFNADISGVRLEQPIHYKQRFSIPSGALSNTYNFTAYANQEYFIILRPVTLTPSSTQYKIVPWFPDGTAFSTLSYATNFNPSANPETMLSNFNVAKNNDPNFVRLPVYPSTLWGLNPTDAVVNQPLGTNPPAIGYDISGVSNDLTDYIGFTAYNGISSINPTAKIRADPTNNYIFQSNSPYSATAQSYFYQGSSNALLTSNADQPYTWKPIGNRQYKMLNYYATTYIPDVGSISNYTSNDVSQYVAPYTISTTSNTPIFGYTYQGAQQTLALGTGLCGWMFLPGTGTWAIDRITFKSNFITPSASINQQIHCLAVFYTSEILARPTSYIRLSNALAVCLKTGSTTYTAGSLNIGFDAAQGTYYTFSNYHELVTRSNFVISGFTQNAKIFINDPNTYYSVVAFNFPAYANETWNISNVNISTLATQLGSANVVYIQNMTGSPIAYPFANQAYPAIQFYDSNVAPTGQGIILSTSNGNNSIYGPPAGADESMSQYQQSLPYVNTNLHYLNPANIVTDLSGFTGWSNLPLQPTFVHASVPNHMLLQNGIFAITRYTSYRTVTVNTPPARNFDLIGQVTIQQIYPDGEQTSLLAVSGDTHGYVFLGASNLTSNISQLRFKRYDVASQTISELPTNSAYTWSNSLLAQHFVWHNTGRWFLTSRSVPSNLVVLQGDTEYSSSNTMLTYVYANKQESELQMDPSGSLLYLATMSNAATGFSNYSMFSFDSNDATGYVRNTSTGYTITLATGNGLPPSYKQMAVSLNNTIEEVLFTNVDFSGYRFYKLRNYQPGANTALSNASVDQSAMQFQNFQGQYIVPSRLIGGAQGSKWVMFNDAPFLQGNRNDAFDSPIALNVAWQIFFPTMKIEMRKLSSGSSPMVDLTNLTYPEWPHTAMFAYNDYRKLVYDISSNGGQWGLERNSNFIVSDVSFNGFYFNSYVMNIPLQSNFASANSNDYYFVAVRGWAPTEKFQTMMRFYLPNRYDFGFVTLRDLSDEVIIASNTPIEVNPVYRTNLLLYNSNFVFSNQNFGSNPTQGFTGSNLTSVSFGDFMRQYYTYYTNFLSNSAVLTEIQASLKTSINDFIKDDLKYILPDSALTRQRYTDPLLFQLLWKTELALTKAVLDDEWGLGWNLGFAKKDTGFATTFTASSFYKIQQDFIYLRLNPEFNINRMDAGGKENYRTTREPTGITNQYYCKLLLTSFGGNATTFIHNPISFNPPLARLTKLQFQWIDANGILINNDDSEWNMTVNITEKVETASIPDKMEYSPGGPQTPAPVPKALLAPKAEEEALKEAKEEAKRNPPEATQTGGIRRDFPPSLPAQWKATLRKEEDLPTIRDLNIVGANTYVNQFSPLTGATEFAEAVAGLTSTIQLPR